jgi:hypothetical protein
VKCHGSVRREPEKILVRAWAGITEGPSRHRSRIVIVNVTMTGNSAPKKCPIDDVLYNINN